MSDSTSVPNKPYQWKDWEQTYAIEAAIKEAQKVNLPGRENGPADAYRHLLWAGELTRRLGERQARLILGVHEIDGRYRGHQLPEAEAMDRYNNELGIALGKSAKTWEELIGNTQAVMDRSNRDGTGGEGQARWLDQSTWRNNPIDRSGKPLGLNWPLTDWNKVQDLPYDYPFGGKEHRYPGAGDGRDDSTPLIDQGVEFWSPDDVRRVMRSPAYQRPDMPQHRVVRAKVRAWFERVHGAGPARLDATGRASAGGSSLFRARGEGGLVHVSAHSREGGKVSVSAYDRSPPSR